MSKNYALIVFVMFSLVFSLGATQCQKGEETEGQAFKYTGTDGITADFAEDAPPSADNWKGEPIGLEVEVQNKGEETVNAGDLKIRLRGIAATSTLSPTKKETSNPEAIESIDDFGESESYKVDLGQITYNPDKMVTSRYTPLIEAEVCYPYVTYVSTDFYVGDTTEYVSQGKINTGDNSNAPVQIGELKESRGASNSVKFNFVVKDVSNGDVVPSCWSSEEKPPQKVKITIDSPSNVECSTLGGGSSGEIELDNGRKRVYCTMTYDESDTEYKDRLVINLQYYYNQKISKIINIENVEE